jgi:hypothetical protein
MSDQKPLGPISQPPADDPAIRKILDERKAQEEARRKADKDTPWGVIRK